MKIQMAAAAIAAVFAAGPAFAQSATDSGTVTVDAQVDPLCVLGEINGGAGASLGGLIETSGANAGKLGAIATQNLTVAASFCNYVANRLTIETVALTAQTFTGAPPSGFSRAVNFTASTTSWTGSSVSAASTVTASGTGTGSTATPASSGASGNKASPTSTAMTLTLSGFQTGGGNLFLVSDAVYQGSVTLTLGPQS